MHYVWAQALLRELIESGVLSHLDPDHQWTLRMLLPRRDKITVKPALPAPACTSAAGHTTAPLPPSGQPAPNTDPVIMLLAALLQPQAPPPQVSAPACSCWLSTSGKSLTDAAGMPPTWRAMADVHVSPSQLT